MHSQHGNGRADPVTMGFININGVSTPGRWIELISIGPDLLLMTETHADSAQQKGPTRDGRGRVVLFGAPVAKSYAGVALAYFSHRIAAVSPLPWKATSCQEWYALGRLLLGKYGPLRVSVASLCMLHMVIPISLGRKGAREDTQVVSSSA